MPQPDDELKRFLQAYPDTSHVDVLFIDLCGNAIGKRLPGSALSALFATGTPVCAAMQLGEAMGNTADPMGYGFSDGDPDAYAIPLPGTLCPVPWLSGNKSQVLCQYVAAGDGKPL
jgi:glutamine synthetase